MTEGNSYIVMKSILKYQFFIYKEDIMDKLQLEARIKEIRAKLDADTERNALEKELRGLEDEYNTIRAHELIPGLLAEEAHNHCITVKENGQFEQEIYKSYGEELPMETIKAIVQSNDPEFTYKDAVEEMYFESGCYYVDDLVRAVGTDLEEQGVEFTDEIKEYTEDYLRDRLEITYPNFDDQEVNVNIIIDSGDANYDYTLNSQYPGSAYNAIRPVQPGEEGYKPYDLDDVLKPEAGIVWLAATQGYTRQQLHEALLNDDIIPEDARKKLASLREANPKLTFLQSMYWEMLNNTSSTPCVTFLVRMTVANLVKLTRLINLQDKDGVFYDATKRPDCGTLTIGKETETGLFDLISGGGSVFEVKLEKDVDIPIRFIRSATPDVNNCQGITWCVGDVYGMCGDVWRDTVKAIKEPEKAEEKKEEE